jgi:hypothetical protein
MTYRNWIVVIGCDEPNYQVIRDCFPKAASIVIVEEVLKNLFTIIFLFIGRRLERLPVLCWSYTTGERERESERLLLVPDWRGKDRKARRIERV